MTTSAVPFSHKQAALVRIHCLARRSRLAALKVASWIETCDSICKALKHMSSQYKKKSKNTFSTFLQYMHISTPCKYRKYLSCQKSIQPLKKAFHLKWKVLLIRLLPPSSVTTEFFFYFCEQISISDRYPLPLLLFSPKRQEQAFASPSPPQPTGTSHVSQEAAGPV